MRHETWIAGLILGCAVLAETDAQSAPPPNAKSNWRLVERLPAGLSVSVKVDRHWHHCAFNWADEEYLQCSLDPGPRPMSLPGIVARPYISRREDVGRIRLERTADSVALGALAGAGVGAALGAARPNGGTTISSAEEGGIIFGVLGSAIGRCIPLVHGKTIYERAGP
jgi:hypothetical protein